MWFDLGRSEGFPSQYAPTFNPVTVDVLEAGFICAFLILSFAFIISILKTNTKQNVTLFVRVFISLLIGLLLMLCNFGQEWEVSHIKTKTPYKAGLSQEINGSIGLKIGLRSVNITLKSEANELSQFKKEIINYNERFEWTWDQGRFGFGPFAGHFQQEFRAAQYKGIPLPILWVAEYFVIDGEGFRFGRFYRIAGWYCHICLWTAFVCWLLAMILFNSVIRYAAYWLGLCGFLQLTANVLWAVIRNPNALKIPFEDATLKPVYGVSFWLTVANGMLCCIISIAIIVLESKTEALVHNFFGLDPLNDYEVAYLTKEEQLFLRKKTSTKIKGDVPLINIPSSSKSDDENPEYVPVYVKRATTIANTPPKVIRSNKPKHLQVTSNV